MTAENCTYILHISYDGTNYYGWQKQPDVPTIQGTLEKLLEKIFGGKAIKTIGASRTDRGVHSEMQVVSFIAPPKYEPKEIFKKLNKMLPDDIAVEGVRCTKEKFSARFDAREKLYRYKIIFQKNSFDIRYAWWLNFEHTCDEIFWKKLNLCASKIIGKHDFSAFSIKQDIPDNPICDIFSARWEKIFKMGFHFFIEGDRFLHKMVRSLVGAMIDVARGNIDENDFFKMLETGERTVEFRTAPPQGLTLVKVFYDKL